MSPPRRDRISDLALQVLSLPPAEREAFLDTACGDDLTRRAVLAAVALEGGAVSVSPADAPTATLLDADRPAPGLGEGRIGPYRLLRKLGEGGMGVVYLAEQERPLCRSVALKLIRGGVASERILTRFDRERQAMALMDHPAIARVFDAGASNLGQPYFVMELVEGEPITAYCDRQRLSTEERLTLFQQVCQGIQHAHQKGVIHRDIKPSNVLVRTEDGRPVPKVIDFGVAKAIEQPLTEDTAFTETGQLVGTPVYMSPEQVAMLNEDIDTRSDVYSLGVMLYELLVGVRPWDADASRQGGLIELRRRILEEDPPRPSLRLAQLGEHAAEVAGARRTDVPALRRRLHGDLDWITMKALEKDRSRRYGSPSELEADIRRHLQHEPVLASPPSTAYRVGKFVRRHRVGVVAGVAVALALVAGIVGTTVGMLRAIEARRAEAGQRVEAERQARIARAVNDFLDTDLLGGVDPRATRDPDVTLREVLDSAAGRIAAAFAEDPQVRAALQSTMGVSYLNLGEYEKAEEQLTASLATLRETAGADAVETVGAMQALGSVLVERGRLSEAEPLLRSALERQRSLLGAEHERTLRTANNYATLLRDQGKLEEAGALYQQVLRDAARVLGEDRELTLVAGMNAANIDMLLGRMAEADELSRRALDAARAALDADHPTALRALAVRAQVLDRRGEVGEAEQLRREVLQLRRQRFGPEHVETLDAMRTLAWALQRNGKNGEAEAMASAAWDGLRRSLGEAHDRTIEAMGTLAVILESRLDGAARALEMKREAYEIRRRALGAAHPKTLESMNNFGVALWYRGDLEGAGTIFEQAREVRTREFGADHPETLNLVNNLGLVRMNQGRLDEAAGDFAAVIEARRRTLGPDHADLASALNNLAMVRGRQERYAEAVELAGEALELQRRKLGPEHAETLSTLLHVAIQERGAGQQDEAAALLEGALETLRRKSDPNLVNLEARMHAALGGCLTDLGRFAEAETHLLEALAVFRRAGWPLSWVSGLLVELYEAWGKPERAAEYATAPPAK